MSAFDIPTVDLEDPRVVVAAILRCHVQPGTVEPDSFWRDRMGRGWRCVSMRYEPSEGVDLVDFVEVPEEPRFLRLIGRAKPEGSPTP